jgi:hypothetical protein
MRFKLCFKCGVEMPLTAFYKHAMMGDGHLNKCKECTKKDATAARLARIEYYRQYDRLRASQPHRRMANRERGRTEHGRELSRASHKLSALRHPDRKRALTTLSNAVRDGRVQKEPCFVCGGEAQAHHSAYSLPLHVTWLCRPHHEQLHKEHRARERQKRDAA